MQQGELYLGSLNAILGSKNGEEPETGPINVHGRSESFINFFFPFFRLTNAPMDVDARVRKVDLVLLI